MKRLLIGIAWLVAVTPVISVCAEELAKIDQSTLLKRVSEQPASLIVLDVRTAEEFAAGHVPGAINIPYSSLPARISELPGAADKDIVLYCATGIRAQLAAERFRENGYTRLLHLEGDMQQWQEKKQRVER